MCTVSLHSADADFSCFADLALVSPDDYYREGEGSLMQCVLTPADPYLPLPNEEIAKRVDAQVRAWTLCIDVNAYSKDAMCGSMTWVCRQGTQLSAVHNPWVLAVSAQCSRRLGCLMKHERTLIAGKVVHL